MPATAPTPPKPQTPARPVVNAPMQAPAIQTGTVNTPYTGSPIAAGLGPTGAPQPNQQPQSVLDQILSGYQQQSAAALGQEQAGLTNLDISQLMGNQAIGEQYGQGLESLLQQQLGINQQQSGLNLQEQYNPIYHLLQNQGYGLQRGGIEQAIGQAGNTREQELKNFYGSEATSGALGAPGQKNQYDQIQYQYQQQMENLNRQLQQLGLTQKGSDTQYQQQQAQEKIQQQSIDNMAQQLGFNKGDLGRRIDQAINNLNLQGRVSAGQIAQAYQDSLNGVYNNLSSILPYIMESGNIPNIQSILTGTGQVTGG